MHFLIAMKTIFNFTCSLLLLLIFKFDVCVAQTDAYDIRFNSNYSPKNNESLSLSGEMYFAGSGFSRFLNKGLRLTINVTGTDISYSQTFCEELFSPGAVVFKFLISEADNQTFLEKFPKGTVPVKTIIELGELDAYQSEFQKTCVLKDPKLDYESDLNFLWRNNKFELVKDNVGLDVSFVRSVDKDFVHVFMRYKFPTLEDLSDIPYALKIEIDGREYLISKGKLQNLDGNFQLSGTLDLEEEQSARFEKEYSVDLQTTLELGVRNLVEDFDSNKFNAFQITKKLFTLPFGDLKPVVPNSDAIYDVAVVQIIDDLETFKKTVVCLNDLGDTGVLTGTNKMVSAYTVSMREAGNCPPIVKKKSLPVLKFSLEELLFTKKGYTIFPSIKSNQGFVDKIKIYSLYGAEQYWNSIASRHGIVETKLGKNPKFRFTILPMLAGRSIGFEDYYPPHGKLLKRYFRDILDKNRVNLENFEFVTNIHYRLFNKDKFRSHASSSVAYVDFPIDVRTLLTNDGVKTIVHEAGHQYFDLKDLYSYSEQTDGAILFPEGAPDPRTPFQENGCIMSNLSYFGTQFMDSESLVLSGKITPEKLAFLANNPHAESELSEYILCADDIQQISSRETVNQSCLIEDFYEASCGQCTSANYVDCKRCDGLNESCNSFLPYRTVSGEILNAKGGKMTRGIGRSMLIATSKTSGQVFKTSVRGGAYTLNLRPDHYFLVLRAKGGKNISSRDIIVDKLNEPGINFIISKKSQK